MKKLIIANWKMNPRTIQEALRLAREIAYGIKSVKNVEVVLAPPFLYIPLISHLPLLTSRIRLGAQNVFYENPPAGGGAYTGEISASQLKALGVRYVITGHSERRALGETNAIVNKKLKSALGAGMRAVLCVGEKEKIKNEAFPQIVRDELRFGLKSIKKSLLKNLIIAYEPVWAVGTGRADTVKNVYEISVMIRRELYRIIGRRVAEQIPILYGGSVDVANAQVFVKGGGVNGLLVGGASLNHKKFVKIVKDIGAP